MSNPSVLLVAAATGLEPFAIETKSVIFTPPPYGGGTRSIDRVAAHIAQGAVGGGGAVSCVVATRSGSGPWITIATIILPSVNNQAGFALIDPEVAPVLDGGLQFTVTNAAGTIADVVASVLQDEGLAFSAGGWV